MFHPQMLEDYAIAAVKLNRQPASEDKPVGEWHLARGGNYPYLKWKFGYEAKIGDKLYLHPAPADQDAQDAARYRWLREAEQGVSRKSIVVGTLHMGPLHADELDAAIDAAIERAGEKK